MPKGIYHFIGLGIKKGCVVVAVDDRYPLGLHGYLATQQSVKVDPFEIFVCLNGEHYVRNNGVNDE